MNLRHKSFYDPEKSYQENYEDGPFGAFANGKVFSQDERSKYHFLGFPVHTLFGIPAGPLVNGRFVKAALDKGFDLPIYKTVRTRPYPCHPWPNVLAVHPEGSLPAKPDLALTADHNYTHPISITNSFGVPSYPPKVWQADLAEVVAYAKPGQVVIGSFQGTKPENGDIRSYLDDFSLGASMMKETGVKIVEVNLSCPNEGTANLLCFDVERVTIIVDIIKKELKSVPLLLKLAYFPTDELLQKFVEKVGDKIQGFCAINTIPATILDENDSQALPGEGRLRSGVCGTSIKWAGQEMVKRLVDLRQKLKMDYVVVGVGGVMNQQDYQEYMDRRADAVMSATGAMWNPYLAQEIKGSA